MIYILCYESQQLCEGAGPENKEDSSLMWNLAMKLDNDVTVLRETIKALMLLDFAVP